LEEGLDQLEEDFGESWGIIFKIIYIYLKRYTNIKFLQIRTKQKYKIKKNTLIFSPPIHYNLTSHQHPTLITNPKSQKIKYLIKLYHIHFYSSLPYLSNQNTISKVEQ
jgi:hypothetical protein